MTGAVPLDVTVAVRAPALPRAVATSRRVQFLDASRGVAVVGMLVANLVNVCLRDIPPLLAHNQGDVLRAFDLPAPVFQFLVGVSLPLFLTSATRPAAVRRFIALIVLGMLLDGVGASSPWPRWGVLQTLGLGGLVATALVPAPTAAVAAFGFVLLAAFSGAANGTVHGSPVAAFAFVPLTLAGLTVGRRIAAGVEPRAVAAEAAMLAAIALPLAVLLHAGGIPFNKVVGTSSFVALTIAVAATVLASAAALEAAGHAFPRWLLLVGRNALTAWVILHVAVYYPAWLAFPEWARLELVPGLVAVVAATSALCALTVALGRRGIAVRL
jgi:predicted acyltransferase